MTEFEILRDDEAPDSWLQRVSDGVDRHNITETGVAEWHPVQFFLKGSDGDCHGGLVGLIWGGWLQVESLWVTEMLRGQGHGARLLAQAEQYAIQKGCAAAALDTHSAAARRLYETHGYKTFATLDDFPPGRAKYFLSKRLAP